MCAGEGGVDWAPQPPDGSEPRDMRQESPFCEMLGGQQRRWLEEALRKSNAPLKVGCASAVGVVKCPQQVVLTVFTLYVPGTQTPVHKGNRHKNVFSIPRRASKSVPNELTHNTMRQF